MSEVDPDEAEIEASRAPLLDHLIELRSRLIVCIAAVFAGFLVCFYFSQPLFEFLIRPFNIAAELLAIREAANAHPPATAGAQALG